MPRKKRLDANAEQVAVYLNPVEKLALSVIAERRKTKGEARTSQSEIVVDGLWKVLAEVEGISRKRIEELLTIRPTVNENPGNVKVFPKT